ncbi:MAG: DUF5667 domain-containing protein [Chloroflexi bacterium]|nr:DUF5667 domain-containing protein [Chloroflexota bacterium]MCL5276048.1 DUF5667 domain-containing protein [Chloroflexota bacterium]
MSEQDIFEQALDEALEHPNDAQKRANLSPELADLMETRAKLDVLNAVPDLPVQAIASTRREFLQAAHSLKAQSGAPTLLQRLGAIFTAPNGSRKRLPTLLSRAALASGLVVVLVGASVGSAMAAAPTSPLYGLKTAIEDTRMNLTNDPGQRAQLALSLALERTQEIEQMAHNGQPVDASIIQRLQQHLDLALENATRMGPAEKAQFLTQLFNQIETRLQTLLAAEKDIPGSNQEMIRNMAQGWQQARAQMELGNSDLTTIPPVTPRPLQTTKTPAPQASLTPFPGDTGLNRAAEAISASLQMRHGLPTELPVTATMHMQEQHGQPTELPPPTMTPAQAQQSRPTVQPTPTAVQQQSTGSNGAGIEPTTIPTAAPTAVPTRVEPTQQPASTPMPTAHPGPGAQPTSPAGPGTGYGR